MKCIMPIFQPVQSTNKRATSTLMRAEGKILPNAGLFVFPCLFILFSVSSVAFHRKCRIIVQMLSKNLRI